MIRAISAAACAAAVALCPLAARAADYKIDGSRLTISGTFYGDREFDDFTTMVRKEPAIKTIVMKQFYGGVNMSNSLSFPKFIRESGLATEVDGPCFSACATAFVGGVRRGLAPTADPNKTVVGFHGAYQAGRVYEPFEITYVNAIRRYTGGRMSEAMIRRAYWLPQNGFLAFFDPRRGTNEKGQSVFVCTGKEKRQVADCEALAGVDGYKVGVFTH